MSVDFVILSFPSGTFQRWVEKFPIIGEQYERGEVEDEEYEQAQGELYAVNTFKEFYSSEVHDYYGMALDDLFEKSGLEDENIYSVFKTLYGSFLGEKVTNTLALTEQSMRANMVELALSSETVRELFAKLNQVDVGLLKDLEADPFVEIGTSFLGFLKSWRAALGEMSRDSQELVILVYG